MTATRLLTFARRLRRDQAGASALEFAILAPVLIGCFCGLVETGQVLVGDRRTSHACNALGDLVAQKASVTTADVKDSFDAARAVMRPLDSGPLKMKVTSVTMGIDLQPRVDWSRGDGLAADVKGAVYTGAPPDLLTLPGDTVVVGKAHYTLVQASQVVITTDFGFDKVAYVHPRNGKVICPTC